MQVQTSMTVMSQWSWTNSTFTRQARELADKLGVELWEHCSPNGSSSVISRLMRIFNLFFPNNRTLYVCIRPAFEFP